MKRLAIALVALGTLTAGCASMRTDRGRGAQIQRTFEQPDDPAHAGDLQGRPELGQR